MPTDPILIATSNGGKLRDFAAAAAEHNLRIAPVPGFSSLPEVVEDGATFEANARKKAEHYSKFAPGQIVLADDSGLEVDALDGAPGVLSARYAALGSGTAENASDAANNARLLNELTGVPDERRTGRFVCVLAAARDGLTAATFRGEARGTLLHGPRGSGGFGYDPLFLFPLLGKSFAELSPVEHAVFIHRGHSFR